MKNLNTRYFLGIDPSGSYKEGKGTTGWCIYDKQEERVIKCGEIRASKFPSQEAYWLAHKHLIEDMYDKYKSDGFVVSIEDYILYTNSAKNQVNSAMETCQLIGVLKIVCYLRCVRLKMRTAVQVKRRWADSILCNKNLIYKTGDSYFTNCYPNALNDHIRDSIRHAMHCATFEMKEEA